MPFKRCLLTTCLIQCWWESSWPPDERGFTKKGIRDERSKWKVPSWVIQLIQQIETKEISVQCERNTWSTIHWISPQERRNQECPASRKCCHLPTWGQFDMTWSYEQCQDHGDCHIRWFYLRAKPKSTSLRVKPFLGKRSSPLSCWWCSKHLPVFTENVLRLDVEMDNVPCVQVLNSWMVTVVKPPPFPALTFGNKKTQRWEDIKDIKTWQNLSNKACYVPFSQVL